MTQSQTGRSIDGAVLDRLEAELRGRAREDAITSAELSQILEMDDGEGSPATREAIGILRRERGIPIRAGNVGYWVCQSEQEAQEYLDTLLSRISGIERTMEEFAEAWEDWDRYATDEEIPEEYRGKIDPGVWEQIQSDPVLQPHDVIDHE
jgi:hypothetical protein